MDIQHFGIIVDALLSWSDEPKAPKKTSGRHAVVASSREGLDDEDEEEIVDDDDFEPDEELNIKPDDGEAADGELAESDQAAAGQAE